MQKLKHYRQNKGKIHEMLYFYETGEILPFLDHYACQNLITWCWTLKILKKHYGFSNTVYGFIEKKWQEYKC